MPFHTLRVDIFEGNAKRFVHGANFVTLRQLRYAFKHRPFFQEHLPYIHRAEIQQSTSQLPFKSKKRGILSPQRRQK